MWSFDSDGSGTWTRLDPSARRFRTLWQTGPNRHEVTCRTTFDANTGDIIGAPMFDYATAKFLNEPLPEPVPRSIRSVFAFDHTEKKVPPECRNVSAPTALADDARTQ